MKNGYGKALCTSVLVLVLASSAFAGDIQYPVAPPSPAPATGDIQYPTTSNNLTPPGAAASVTEVDTVTRIALNLLQSVLTLF